MTDEFSELHEGIDKVFDLQERLNFMKPYDLMAKCGWDGDVLHIELPEPPKAIYVHHPNGTVCFGVPTGVEQELRDEISRLRRKSMFAAFDLIAENEKLRALVSDMLRTYRNVGTICDGCGYEMNCDGTDCQGDEYSLFLGRARKLGIEAETP